MVTKTFEIAKVGDKVYSLTFGWGEIVDIKIDSKHPVGVRFYNDGGIRRFTVKGCFYKSSPTQSLFWNEISIEAPVKPVAMKIVNGVEISDISFKPEHEEHYYMPYPTSTCAYQSSIFYSCEEDYYRSNNNLCYPYTEEGKQAAISHAKAMLGTS